MQFNVKYKISYLKFVFNETNSTHSVMSFH